MTLPNFPGNGPARDSSGYVQMQGGYDSAVQQANRGNVPQYTAPQPTQLGQGTPQAFGNQQPLLMEQVSPLSQIPPRVAGIPQQQQQQQGQPGQQYLTAAQVQQQQYQQQVAQYQQQAPVGMDLTQRLAGPNVPAELQGRSVGELVGMLNGLRQVHLAAISQQPQNQPAQSQQPAPQSQQQQQQTPQAFDWKNPQDSIGRVVDEHLNRAIDTRLAPMLAPIVQQGQTTAVTQARNVAAQEIGPAFAQLEPLVMQRLQGLRPQDLQNAETWKVATRAVIGDIMIAGAQRGQNAVPQNNQNYQQQPGMYPVQQVQNGQNPMPNLNGFFSEQPMQGGPMNTGARLSPQQMRAADLMGMSQADYAAWSIGVPNGGSR